jgi:hypothetical protein
MTIATILRATGLAAALLFSPAPLAAQNEWTPPSAMGIGPAPVGHRQPRAADIPIAPKSEAEILEERRQAELNRKLRICRGC